MSKRIISSPDVSVNQHSARSVALASRVAVTILNPLVRVEQLKRQFLTTQLSSLRAQIYAELHRSGWSDVSALAEIDRMFVDISRAVAVASTNARKAAAAAELAERGSAWVERSLES